MRESLKVKLSQSKNNKFLKTGEWQIYNFF